MRSLGRWWAGFLPELVTLTNWPTTHRKTPSQEGLPLEHVAGDRCIHEDLLGLTFQISPHAFFQVVQSPRIFIIKTQRES